MKKLKLRLKLKRKKPRFVRQGGLHLKRVGMKWRKARGIQSKLRQYKKNRGFLPKAGYGSPITSRYLHPSGLEEVLIHNVEGLKNIDSIKQCCRIASGVGKKKRIDILKKANELKIKILNPSRAEPIKKEVKK